MANAGYSSNPTYKIWVGIRLRCRDHTTRGSSDVYRGVRISESWSEEFENFLNDMGERPFHMASVDRIDGTRGYCKHNCRWATKYQQAVNRRGVNASVSEGVRLKKSGTFEARISILGRMFHIGTFKTRDEAEREFKKYKDYLSPMQNKSGLQSNRANEPRGG